VYDAVNFHIRKKINLQHIKSTNNFVAYGIITFYVFRLEIDIQIQIIKFHIIATALGPELSTQTISTAKLSIKL
jgi:hypothetical protein